MSDGAKESVDLLPCPFCGPGQSQISHWYDDSAHSWRVGCGRCGVHTGIFPHKEDRTQENAAKSWNTRATPPAAPAGGEPNIDGKQLINDVLAWYAGKNITPGEGWAFTDDNSSLCFEDSHRVTGHSLWVDLENDGRVNVLFRPNDKAEIRSLRFVASAAPAQSNGDESRVPIKAPGNDQLSKLWNAIVENTKGDGFWIGEILLTTLEREVGFNPAALKDIQS